MRLKLKLKPHRAPAGGLPSDAAAPTLKEMVTPEGVPLRFALAALGDRGAAFALDALLIIGATLLFALLCLLLGSAGLGGWATALFFVGSFLLRNLYFIGFEIKWGGQTPGKRKVGIRVIDRNGGMLTAEAIVGRNLMRELEIFVPLVVWLAPEALAQQGLVGVLLLLTLVPLFNRDRLRVGDMIAGTLVIRAPKASLLSDLSERPAAKRRYVFTKAQLDMYGIYELQVLEELLRNPRKDKKALELVCDKVKRKIGWPKAEKVDARSFLREFYDAQRGRLEQQMLMGERRERKRKGRLR